MYMKIKRDILRYLATRKKKDAMKRTCAWVARQWAIHAQTSHIERAASEEEVAKDIYLKISGVDNKSSTSSDRWIGLSDSLNGYFVNPGFVIDATGRRIDIPDLWPLDISVVALYIVSIILFLVDRLPFQQIIRSSLMFGFYLKAEEVLLFNAVSSMIALMVLQVMFYTWYWINCSSSQEKNTIKRILEPWLLLLILYPFEWGLLHILM
jgi:head-tail adaptor